MNGVKKVLCNELTVTVVLSLLAYFGVTRPVASIQPAQIYVVGQTAAPDVQATVYSATWCKPCKKYVGGGNTDEFKHGLKDEMPGDGWIIRNDTAKDFFTAHIIVTESEADWNDLKIESLPTTIIRRKGKEVHRFTGRMLPDDLAKLINKFANQKD